MNKVIVKQLEALRERLDEQALAEALDAVNAALAEAGYEIEADTLEAYEEGLREALLSDELDEDLKKMVFGAWRKVKQGAKRAAKSVRKAGRTARYVWNTSEG